MRKKLFNSISFVTICAAILSISLFTGCFGDDDKTDTPVTPPVTPPGDTTAPTVSSTTPADGAGSINPNDNIVIVFSEAMDTSTITTNISGDTTCSGTVQPSSDDFTTCWEFISTPSPSVGDTTFTLDPDGAYGPGSMKLRITTGAKDAAGNALAEKTISFTTL